MTAVSTSCRIYLLVISSVFLSLRLLITPQIAEIISYHSPVMHPIRRAVPVKQNSVLTKYVENRSISDLQRIVGHLQLLSNVTTTYVMKNNWKTKLFTYFLSVKENTHQWLNWLSSLSWTWFNNHKSYPQHSIEANQSRSSSTIECQNVRPRHCSF